MQLRMNRSDVIFSKYCNLKYTVVFLLNVLSGDIWYLFTYNITRLSFNCMNLWLKMANCWLLHFSGEGICLYRNSVWNIKDFSLSVLIAWSSLSVTKTAHTHRQPHRGVNSSWVWVQPVWQLCKQTPETSIPRIRRKKSLWSVCGVKTALTWRSIHPRQWLMAGDRRVLKLIRPVTASLIFLLSGFLRLRNIKNKDTPPLVPSWHPLTSGWPDDALNTQRNPRHLSLR